MKLEKLKCSLGAKIAAQVLLFLMVAIFTGSMVVTFLLANSGAYQGKELKVQDLNWYYYFQHDAARAADYYERIRQGFSAEAPFATDKSNFSFMILEPTAWEQRGEAYALFISRGAGNGVQCDVNWEHGYYVACLLNPDFPVQDKYQQAFQVFQELFALKWLFVGLMPLTFIIGLLLFIYLMAAAGHRRDGTLALGISDRIPLDVHLLLAALPISFLLFGVLEISDYQTPTLGISLALCLLAAAYTLAMWFFMSIARRVKHRGWWRNSALYHICAFCRRNGRRVGNAFLHALSWCKEKLNFIFSQLPFVWKVDLVAVALFFALAWVWYVIGWNEIGFCFVVTFLAAVLAVFFLTKYCGQMRLLKAAGEDLAAGRELNIDCAKLGGLFLEHADNLGKLHEGMARSVEAQIRSERLKTELITNVSHDIKTPLTSIINYIDLLRREEDGEKQKEYIEILDKHSKRLKKLTEDLLEVSKVSTGNVSVSLERLDLRESVNQAIGEYSERLAEAGLNIVVQMPEQPVPAMADGRHMWRVLDNLLSNVCKYSLPASRVYCSLETAEGYAALGLKNISKEPLNISPDELMERFVRGDAARSSEGSGLGLSIAESLTSAQNGSFFLDIDGDLFKTELRFPLAESQTALDLTKE